ncbi:uncharacterized protein FIBRA_02876 [Fibroporia radiculosa]|uniref:Mtf2-like C-terminal domain-containing protein n=1 Tax=Fibroporia radiculosa TaxID=599839 RepID=J4H235_9APHY|nr:uncharacterized protein FIBRA_02876 [Fibroporia radiculosa]CCM00834.1 predicted protein [Fibroporia radiculosa]
MLGKHSLKQASSVARIATSEPCPPKVPSSRLSSVSFPSHTHTSTSTSPSTNYCHSQRRFYSTGNSSKPTNKDSIFSPSASPWDHVFDDIVDKPSLLPSTARASGAQTSRFPRRQRMTVREINAFDEMFNMIFSAVSEKNIQSTGSKPRSLSPTLGIGRRGSSEMGDLFGRLRKQSKHIKWTDKADEDLDRKKEQMELCNTDQQLLDWAMKEVFAESQRYEENARRSLENPTSSKEPVQLQPPAYPHLISLLMRTFREKYADPHLSLSIFDHARHLSIPSFVFGCTTPAYNELIETRWRCFRDLRGVCDALEEMRVNGVEMDNRTRSLAEMIRREVGERNLWQEESSMGSGEAWDMVAKIEQLTAKEPFIRRTSTSNVKKSQKKWTWDQESWKRGGLNASGSSNDGWEFGRWDSTESSGSSTPTR